MKVLIVVDVQSDFMSPAGALSVKDAESIIPNINKLLESERFDYKLITQDWHPLNHVSFASTHGAAQFTTKQTIQGSKAITQMMWPNHCVQGSDGAEVHPHIMSHLADAVLRKGMNPHKECYSVFSYVSEETARAFTPHGVAFLSLSDNGVVDEIVICGVATDYCCKATTLDATLFSTNVVVVSDAVAAVDSNNVDAVYEELTSSGVKVALTKDYI